ncbi:hypothetical protein HMPREF9538_01848 [Klebsiella sp. MS 92-3]|nr:hypothetical protein HMPREF9538_01848 [Klebsiella sp. MS 92-3]
MCRFISLYCLTLSFNDVAILWLVNKCDNFNFKVVILLKNV